MVALKLENPENVCGSIMRGLTNLGIHLILGGRWREPRRTLWRLIKEWHNGIDWCDCFIAPEVTNHFLLNV